MKRTLVFLIFCIAFIPAIFSIEVTKKKINLEVSGEVIINVPNLNGISNAGDIVEDTILNDGESVMLRGASWGETQVTAWDKIGNRFIYEIEVAMPKFVKELQNYIQDIEGVNVNFLGRNIIVEGQLLTENDVPKLTGILNNFPEVKNMVNMKPVDKNSILIEAIKSELFNQNFKFSFLGEGLMYEGRVFSEEEGNNAKAVSQIYFDAVYPAFTIKPPEVEFNIHFLDFNFSDNKKNMDLFGSYLSTLKQKDLKNLSHFTFYNSKFHNQSLEKIMKAGTARPLKEDKALCLSLNKTLWKSDPKSKTIFSLEFLPIVFNPDWVDLNVNFSIESEGKNLIWQTARVVLKKGQGTAIIGMSELINKMIPDDKKQSLNEINVLSPFINGNNSLIILITPNWTLRE